MEQLVLLVKALRALKLPLLFARGEIRVGHLKSSNAVKNGETDRCSEALPFSQQVLVISLNEALSFSIIFVYNFQF